MAIQPVQTTLRQPMAASAAPDRAAEANHRIADSLSLIASMVRLQASGIEDAAGAMGAGQVRRILEGFGGRIDTVARLHHLLTDADQRAAIDLADYLRDISDAAVSALSSAGRMDLTFALEGGCLVAAQRARGLGLIVAELVVNSVKYAHPAGVDGKIGVGCRRSRDGTIVVEVSDDGVGLPEGFDPMTGGHVGFHLVRSFADQLGASCSFASGPLGLSVQIEMPLLLLA